MKSRLWFGFTPFCAPSFASLLAVVTADDDDDGNIPPSVPSTVYLGYFMGMDLTFFCRWLPTHRKESQNNETLKQNEKKTFSMWIEKITTRSERSISQMKWNVTTKNYVRCEFCIALEADDNNDEDDNNNSRNNTHRISNPMEKNYPDKLFNSNNNGKRSRIFSIFFFFLVVVRVRVQFIWLWVSWSPILSMMMLSSSSLIRCAQWNFYVFI